MAVRQEIGVLSKVGHQLVASLSGVVKQEGRAVKLVMELHAGGVSEVIQLSCESMWTVSNCENMLQIDL